MPSTVIQNVLSGAQAVIQLGSSALTNVVVRDLVVDCQGLTEIGIQNQNAGSGTVVQGVRMINCTDTGLEVSTSGAANSGPYRDLVVTPGTSSISSTTCVRVGISSPWGLLGKPRRTTTQVAGWWN
jgi:hypothetical protein